MLLAASAAARADEVVAELARDTPIAAYGGVVAWSDFDARSGHYALVLRDGATTLRARIAPARRPFDVSLGPDVDGRVVAVYTRCGAGGRGCDIYRYAPRSGQEVRLRSVSSPRHDEAWPAISGRRLTFVRRARARVDELQRRDPHGSTTMDCDIPFVATLPAGRPRRLDRGDCAQTTGMSIRGARIVQVTDYSLDFNAAYTQVRLLRASGGARPRILASGTSGLAGHSPFVSPSQSATAIWLTRVGDRDAPDFLRIDAASGRLTSARPGVRLAGRVARDERGTFWYVQAPDPQDEEEDHGYPPFCTSPYQPCRLVRTSASPFSPAPRVLPVQIAVQDDAQAGRITGTVTRPVVRRGRIVRTLALAAVAVELRRGVPIPGNDEFGTIAFQPSGPATLTDASGRWSFAVASPSAFAAYVAVAPALRTASEIVRIFPK